MKPIAASLIAAFVLFGIAVPEAHALDTVRVGKAINDIWVYTPLDVGMAEGIFEKYGLQIEVSVMPGGAKLQQGLLAGSLDMGLGGSQSMALAVKGSPIVAVASLAGAPREFAVLVSADSPIKKVSDLKGKVMAVASNGSLTEWLTRHLSIAEGWGPNGIKISATGGSDASVAALLSHQVDADMSAAETALLIEEKGQGRIVTEMEKYAPDFITQVVFTRQPLVAEKPELVVRFLRGMFASIAYVKSHKDRTVEISSAVLHLGKPLTGRIYDDQLSILSDDGRFDPKAMDVLKESFIDLGILTEKPTDAQILTTRFLPVKP